MPFSLGRSFSRRESSGPAMKTLRAFGLPLVILAAVLTGRAGAVILLNPEPDPPENKVAPTGRLAGSGWEFQGTWGGFLGTPVAPQFFITAKHCGGNVGQVFSLGGTSYKTVKRFDSPSSDLTLWEISGTFPAYAPLYTKSDEVNKQLVVFGRGTERGSQYAMANSVPPGADFRGWSWGPGKGVQRWGTNVVTAAIKGPGEIMDRGERDIPRAGVGCRRRV